jgi:hypothetical protein
MAPRTLDSRARIVGQLAEQVRRIERGPLGLAGVSSGCPALDRLLPQGRFTPGTLVEWLAAGPASGAGTLAFSLARQAACALPGGGGPTGSVVVVDRQGDFYPPAVRGLGFDLGGLIVVHPRSEQDERWAVDQVLRSRGVAALVAWPQRLDGHTFRRWQLAAEAGGCLGLLLRPERARREPSWAEARLWVEPRAPIAGVGSAVRTKFVGCVQRSADAPALAALVRTADPTGGRRRVRVEVLHARGGATGRSVELEIDDATGIVRVAPPLAAAEILRRSAGA